MTFKFEIVNDFVFQSFEGPGRVGPCRPSKCATRGVIPLRYVLVTGHIALGALHRSCGLSLLCTMDGLNGIRHSKNPEKQQKPNVLLLSILKRREEIRNVTKILFSDKILAESADFMNTGTLCENSLRAYVIISAIYHVRYILMLKLCRNNVSLAH